MHRPIVPAMAGRIRVGTSSWADPGFVEEWYPQDLPARDRLPWYAERFEVVEVNSSFYAVPSATPCAAGRGHAGRLQLRREAPPAAVAPLRAAGVAAARPARRRARPSPRGRVVLDAELERRWSSDAGARVEPLDKAGKLGAFLLQLTPAFSPRRARARASSTPLVEALAPHPVAVELRHRALGRATSALEDTLRWY